MNRFTADFSSSVNSAPAEDTPPQHKRFIPINADQLASTTPLVPPPSTIFGSSRLGSGVSKLQLNKNSDSSLIPSTPSSHRPPTDHKKNGAINQAGRQFHSSMNESTNNNYEYEDEDGEYDDDFGRDDSRYGSSMQQSEDFTAPGPPRGSMPSLMKFSTTSGRQSQVAHAQKRSVKRNRPSQLPRQGQINLIPRLVQDLATRIKPAPLEQNDAIILETEQILQDLEGKTQDIEDTGVLQSTIDVHAHQLINCWQRQIIHHADAIDSTSIGPPPSASSFNKANYLASLLLAIHHPPLLNERSEQTAPIPQIVLDWLDNYHVSYEPLYHAVASTSPNVTSHELFWDALQSLVLRGKLAEVMRLLAEADFKHAASAVEEDNDEPGYRGAQLQTIQSVIYRARQILNSCPAIEAGNWDIVSSDWDIFRRRLETELNDLTRLAAEDTEEEKGFEAENFGIHRANFNTLGKSSQKSSFGNLPWAVYQGLKIMYSILLGSAEEIIAQSQDWLEASAALTVWWDGAEEAKIAQWSFDVSRANDQEQTNEVQAEPYLRRLRDSFLCVTDPNDKNSFPINALSPVEVGLGAVLQGDIESVLVTLQALSQCVASAIAEVGTWAGWVANDSPPALPDLDQADMMVLNFGAPNTTIQKDDILLNYADALFDRGELHTADGELYEGWELSISILTRMNNEETMRTTIGEFLDRLPMTDQPRAEKVINLCSDLGLQEEAQKISERFGDYLVNNTSDYGTALLCYARSHNSHKIRQVVDLLNSYCLVQSKAYPAEDEADSALRGLVGNSKNAFNDIAEVDPEAAATLQFYLVGYACLRKFYNLRDEEVLASKTHGKPSLRPLVRKRAAAKVLTAAINSAADTIYGGLYDEERESAIQVDGLLSLFGEATSLLAENVGTRIYTSDQMYALLAAIEDIETVSKRVYDAAEECLQSALRNYNGSLPPSPHAMLKKSMSSGTNSNFSFSMMGSEMLARSGESIGGKSVGSTVLVAGPGRGDHTRGWDWRASFKGSEHGGADVLRVLRRGIAKELTMAELEN